MRIYYVMPYPWTFCWLKVTKCLASDENFNGQKQERRKTWPTKIKTNKTFWRTKIKKNEYNSLQNKDIFLYDLLACIPYMKYEMSLVALIKPKCLALGLYKVESFLEFLSYRIWAKSAVIFWFRVMNFNRRWKLLSVKTLRFKCLRFWNLQSVVESCYCISC